MAATFSFGEAYGSPGIVINGSITNVNMGSLGSPNLTAASYPITRGENSYEKYIFGSWGGTFTKIDNLQFYASAGSYGTGEVIKWQGSSVTTFTPPVTTTSVVATGSLPFADPGTANVSIANTLAGSIYASPGSSDYIVLQYQTTSSAAVGPTNTKTLTLQWDEL